MDYNYEYHYLKKEKFDLGSALANVGAAVAVGAMFPGVGAAVMAGISSGIGASQMTKGSIDIHFSCNLRDDNHSDKSADRQSKKKIIQYLISQFFHMTILRNLDQKEKNHLIKMVLF